MRRTKAGLTLVFEDGQWVTEDGAYLIGRVREITFCDGPHPQRDRTYCPGGEEHDRECGWDVRKRDGGDACKGNLFETLTEAWTELAKEVSV